MNDRPTPGQVFAAKVRAAYEAEIKKRRRPYKPKGGKVDKASFIIPPGIKAKVAAKFGMPEHELSRYLTYSRNGNCTHPWSEGACADCPPTDHLYSP